MHWRGGQVVSYPVVKKLTTLRRSGTDIYKPFKAHNLEIAGSTPDLRNQKSKSGSRLKECLSSRKSAVK